MKKIKKEHYNYQFKTATATRIITIIIIILIPIAKHYKYVELTDVLTTHSDCD